MTDAVNSELVERVDYHSEQLSTYLAQPTISETDLASARWHNNKIREAVLLSATNSEAVSELVEAARVLAEGEFELAPDAAAFEAAMDRLAEAVAKLGSRAPAA
jgi:hypothetical protein